MLLAKCFAGALVILTLVPFTAPFPACDFNQLSAAERPGTNRQTSSANVLADSCSHALPVSNLSPRIRFVAVVTSRRSADYLPSVSPRWTRIRFINPIELPDDTLAALRI